MTQQKLNRIANARYQKNICTFFFVIFFNSIAWTQSNVAPPAKRVARFPFTMLTGGIVILEAKLAPFSDTLNFILDTGSGGISLDSLTVEHFKLKPIPSERVIRGIAGSKKVSFVKNSTLILSNLQVDSLDFHVIDYSILTSVYGMKIDGIIGYSFLNRYIVKMDYEKYIMEVWEPGVIKYPRGGYLLKPTISNIPILTSRIKDGVDNTSRFYFDSGAGLAMLFSENYIKDSSILKKNKKIILTQAEGLGGKKDMRVTTVKEVKLGPYRFRKVPAYLFDDEFNATSYPQYGGLMGNEILRRFNTIFNYPDREIHLIPNNRFHEPFDYSYTGLGIYMVDGDIIVEDVIKDSPGEKAGFKVGDIIFSIDKNFSNNIQTYRTLLQKPGTKLKVLVSRDNELVFLTLEVKSIL